LDASGDIRDIQLARILGLPRTTPSRDLAEAVRARPADVARALFEEAADNDDVTGQDSALAYLEDRLAYFGEGIPSGVADAIRREFEHRLAAWE
jgi:hypothetical protein